MIYWINAKSWRKEDVDQESYSRLFLAAFRSVKIWSEKLAEEKAKSKR